MKFSPQKPNIVTSLRLPNVTFHSRYTTLILQYLSAILVYWLNPIFPSLLYAEELIDEGFRSGKVTANALHVRAKPGEKYEVVGRLSFGNEVVVKKENKDWLGISAPKKTDAWIALNQLKGSKIVDENVPVYSGPGTIFSSYHILNRGEIVSVIKTVKDQWVKIEPLEDFVVWVHRDYVNILSLEGDKVSRKADGDPLNHQEGESIVEPELAHSGSTDEKEADTPREDDPLIHAVMPLPIDRNIVLIGEKEKIKRNGTIVQLDKTNKPFNYALAKKINSTYYPIAYLSPGYANLAGWSGKRVTVSGIQSWVRGWPRPMIQIESVQPVESKD